ncbi:MAG: hypothetical protein D6725_13840, partial [Planctomycetota bacterium]
MKRQLRNLGVLALIVSLSALPALADQAKKKGKKAGKKKPAAVAVEKLVPKSVAETLTDEQKEKIRAIAKDYQPKLAELRKKLAGAITPQQRKARAEALKKARAEGKKGKEALKAAEEAAGLTEDQKKQVAEIQKQIAELTREMRAKIAEVLTPEQRAKLPGRKRG